MWSAIIYFLLILNIFCVAEIEDYDEVAKFNEVLELENPLAILFTEECCKCTDCVEAEVLLGGMSKLLEDSLGILVIRLKKKDLRSQYGIKNVPALVFIRKNKAAQYDGPFEMDSVHTWLQENIEPVTVNLDDHSFEHLTQAATGATTGDWLVIFHDGSCCKNRELLYLENAGIKLRNRVNVASVNIQNSPETTERFKIQKCPSLLFFRHQKMYKFNLPDVTTTALIRFAESFYKNSKADNVPLPPSAFDKFTDKVVEKAVQFYNEYWNILLSGLALTAVFTTSVVIYTILKPASRVKKE